MAEITLKGNAIHTVGNLPEVGTQAPNFKLVKTDLSVASLDEYKGKKVYFCCPSCEEKFNADPEKYISKLPQFE